MITIVGLGNIGSAIYSITKQIGHYTTVDIKEYKNGEWKKLIIESNTIFFCIPVNNKNNKQDTEALHEYLEYLKMHSTKNPLIFICSTVLPDVVDEYKDYLNIVYFPQFMNERNAINEIIDTKYIVLGTNSIIIAKSAQQELINLLYLHSDVKFELTSLEYASYFKYLRNFKMAYNITFWNYINQFCQSEGLDYRKIKDMMDELPVNEYSQVADDSKLGFGGTCLPKDLDALNDHFPHEITEVALKFNKEIRNKI